MAGRPPIRALVVDDCRDAAETLARILEAMGCSANFVTDSTTAMEAVAAMDAQIVFIDLGMPAINGFELAEMFRTRYGQSVRLVAVMAYGGTGVQIKCGAAGFDAHVQKPFDPGAIKRTLDSCQPQGRET